MSRKKPVFMTLLIFSLPALTEAATLAECASIANDGERLACFDSLAAASAVGEPQTAAQLEATPSELLPPLSEPEQSDAPLATAGEPHKSPESAPTFSLADHWELTPEYKRGVFKFRPHRNNYLIATYSHDPNDDPYRPFQSLNPDSSRLSNAELAFQIGFKLKFAENVLNTPADLWFGYTQQSFWQASNREASSPFRETNYQPEVMAVMPLNFNLLGMKVRFANLGFVHQSNGQTSTLSRSWNRFYAQVGMERGNFSLLARMWKRVNESVEEDDNPDIIDYMGHGDLIGTYRRNGHEFSVLTRYNFSTDKGAVQLGWAFPLKSKLKGYVQWFSGYGQSLIDYNYSVNSIGMGVQVNY